ncbi:ABC transporter permease [Pilimelia anulata]|uniref:ABC transporter permease n=1 Tax=Pilimelia anulata TaxID=53371 RepID=A0A8J3AYY2_9ACTN|nr:ECF transporter S component [Pilimelia anulata]GGJ74460.1 ABC transporter permease [Pilimelia anulata]
MERSNRRWRTVDVLVASVLGVAFGVIFWAWNLLWNGPAAAVFAGFKPAAGLIYGVWLVPAVVGPLVLRKPGAAVYCELLAAIVSALLGSPWGLVTVVYGLFQGLAGEFAFAATAYRAWRLPVAIVAGALAGAAAALVDLVQFYAAWGGAWQVAYAAMVVASAAAVAGVGGWYLTRALAGTGVLDAFPSGRARPAV